MNQVRIIWVFYFIQFLVNYFWISMIGIFGIVFGNNDRECYQWLHFIFIIQLLFLYWKVWCFLLGSILSRSQINPILGRRILLTYLHRCSVCLSIGIVLTIWSILNLGGCLLAILLFKEVDYHLVFTHYLLIFNQKL